MTDFNGYAGPLEVIRTPGKISLFSVLAADETDARLASRKALLLAQSRVDDKIGKWLSSKSAEEFDAKFSYVESDFNGLVQLACEEVGHDNPKAIAQSLREHFRPVAEFKPFEKKDENEGEKDEEKDDDEDESKSAAVSETIMALAASIDVDDSWPVQEELGDASPDRVSAGPKDDKYSPSDQKDDSGKEVSCPECGGSGETNGGKECPKCKGKGKVNDWGPSTLDKVDSKTAAEGDGNTGLSGPSPKMDKAKWTPENVKKDFEDSKEHPTKEKDPIEPIRALNDDELTEIGEKTTEHVELDSGTEAFSDGGETKGDSTKTWGKGKHEVDPVTKESISHTAAGVDFGPGAEQAQQPQQGFPGQTPTAMPYNPQVQEEMASEMHPAAKYAYDFAVQQGANPQDAMQQAQAKQQEMIQRATMGQGIDNVQIPVVGKTDDVNKNPLLELVENESEGFVPQATVQRVTAALRK